MGTSVLIRPSVGLSTWGLMLIVLLITVLFIIDGDLTHFTWFSILLFDLYCVLAILGLARANFYWFVTVQTIVIVGVIFMSIQGCHLLRETLSGVGGVVYFIGNFAMHYAPFLIALAEVDTTLLEKSMTSSDIADILLGFGIFTLYLGLYKAGDVYGCSTGDDVTFLVSLLVVSVMCIARRAFSLGSGYNILIDARAKS